MDLAKKLKHVSASVWDMDGCVYPYDKGFPQTCNETAVHALFHIIDKPLPDNMDEWAAKAKASFMKTGSPVKDFSVDHDIDFDQIDGVYHQLLNVEMLVPEPDFAFHMASAIDGGHKTHLATHSHEFFTTRALEVLGLSSVFQMQANVFTLNQHGFEHRKAASPKMILDAVKRLEADPARTIFVEDTIENFVPVKDTAPEITTVLVARNGMPVTKPTEIDLIVPSATHLAKALPRLALV